MPTLEELKIKDAEIKRQIEEARKKKIEKEENQKIVKETIAMVGNGLSESLKPLLTEIVKITAESKAETQKALGQIQNLVSIINNNAQENNGKLKEAISSIKLAAPDVNVKTEVPKAEVKVDVAQQEIKTDKLEKVIKDAIAKIKLPTPKVDVKAADVIIPKKIKVDGIDELRQEIKKISKLEIDLRNQFTRDQPLDVVLRDEKGEKFKFPSQVFTGTGGGGSKVLQDIPLGYEQLTITDTATGFASIPAKANKVILTVDAANIRYKDNGGDPTSTAGLLAYRAATIILNSPEAIANFKAIRTGASSAILDILYYETR